MEKMREEENRGGQPHNNSAGAGRGRNEAPMGFEGMNFEQKRQPYRAATRLNGETGQAEQANDLRKRDDL